MATPIWFVMLACLGALYVIAVSSRLLVFLSFCLQAAHNFLDCIDLTAALSSSANDGITLLLQACSVTTTARPHRPLPRRPNVGERRRQPNGATSSLTTSTSTIATTATRRRDLEPDDLNLHSVLEPDDLGLNLDNLHSVKVRRWQPDARAGGDGNPTHRRAVTQHAGRQ
jgi:hypothetical protein